MATINIGTDKGNIVAVEIKKSFMDITPDDVQKIAVKKYGKGVRVNGWAFTRKKRNKK